MRKWAASSPGSRTPVVSALARYGDGLGVAFQMADDLLDWGGASGAIGKNTGDDSASAS